MTHLPIMTVRYRASGTILNPWYEYPVIRMFGSDMALVEDAPEICSPCSMPLPELGLVMIAEPRDLIFVFSDSERGVPAPVEQLRQYIMYRTFLNYNVATIVSPWKEDPAPILREHLLEHMREQTKS
jgi:hypothetical protein